jgi:hypothetical protein
MSNGVLGRLEGPGYGCSLIKRKQQVVRTGRRRMIRSHDRFPMMSFGSMPASPSVFDQGGNKAFFFLSVSVPEDTSTSIITIWSERGLGRAG